MKLPDEFLAAEVREQEAPPFAVTYSDASGVAFTTSAITMTDGGSIDRPMTPVVSEDLEEPDNEKPVENVQDFLRQQMDAVFSRLDPKAELAFQAKLAIDTFLNAVRMTLQDLGISLEPANAATIQAIIGRAIVQTLLQGQPKRPASATSRIRRAFA